MTEVHSTGAVRTRKPRKPKKPYPGFPLFPHTDPGSICRRGLKAAVQVQANGGPSVTPHMLQAKAFVPDRALEQGLSLLRRAGRPDLMP
jgi:hypothetical protein